MQVGFAVSDITPELGIYLTGYGRPERLATGVHSPLTATAMVLKDGEKEAVVIGLDWCVVDWELTQEIRKGIVEAAGVPEKNILLCCSHTHSAPHTTYMRTLGRVAVDPENKGVEYVKKSIPAIADAVRRAKESLHETAAAFAAGKTETGISRRGMSEEGRVTGFIGDPDLIYDSNMTAVQFIDRRRSQGDHEKVRRPDRQGRGAASGIQIGEDRVGNLERAAAADLGIRTNRARLRTVGIRAVPVRDVLGLLAATAQIRSVRIHSAVQQHERAQRLYA